MGESIVIMKIFRFLGVGLASLFWFVSMYGVYIYRKLQKRRNTTSA